MIDSDTIFSLGPATDESQPTVLTLDGKGVHAHLAGDAAGDRYIGIEVEIDGEEDEYTYLYLTADDAELLAQHLMAAAAKTREER
jgi:hypothetical protein